MAEKTININKPLFSGNADIQGLLMNTNSYGLIYGFIVDSSINYIEFGRCIKKGFYDNTVVAGASDDDSDNYGVAVFNSAISKDRDGASNKYLSGMPIDVMVDGYMWFRPSNIKEISRGTKIYADKKTGEIVFSNIALDNDYKELTWCRIVLLGEDKKSILVRISPIIPIIEGGGAEIKLQNKSVSITSNGITSIEADEGYNGLSKVDVNVNVSSGSGENNAKFDAPTTTEIRQNIVDECITSLDASSWDTSKYTQMRSMFSGCKNLQSINVSNWNTSNVTIMESMFSSCSSLKELDLSSFNTSKVTSMLSMFSGCRDLKTINLSSFDTSKVTNMSYMFSGCTSLTIFDLSSFDTFNVISATGMLNSPYLYNVTWGANWMSNDAITVFDISSASFIQKNSVLDLINKLATRTNSPTLKLATYVKKQLSEDEIKIATDKGWTIA